jgi:hypothetical protein
MDGSAPRYFGEASIAKLEAFLRGSRKIVADTSYLLPLDFGMAGSFAAFDRRR